MVKIYLTRHGETVENSLGQFQGHAPGHLSEKGKELCGKAVAKCIREIDN